MSPIDKVNLLSSELRKLKKVKGLTFRRIAREMGCSHHTVVSIFKRALIKLIYRCAEQGLSVLDTIRALDGFVRK